MGGPTHPAMVVMQARPAPSRPLTATCSPSNAAPSTRSSSRSDSPPSRPPARNSPPAATNSPPALDDAPTAPDPALLDPVADHRPMPSKVLITSRMAPDALQGASGALLPGFVEMRLPGRSRTSRSSACYASSVWVHGQGRRDFLAGGRATESAEPLVSVAQLSFCALRTCSMSATNVAAVFSSLCAGSKRRRRRSSLSAV